MAITGILLAAGRGSRFDPSGARDKLLQPLTQTSVVAASAQTLLSVLPRVVAVVRPGGEAVAAELRALGCDTIVCELADTGMAASLMHAIRHAADADGWIVALGDMPHVAPSTIQSLKSALEEGADIAAPVYRGKRGNPVGFGRPHLSRLLALEGDQGARGILRQFPVREVGVDDGGILRDIDTPEDLHRQG
ncbi:nucleotidyltransferase family protein [Pseudoduganella namucuonensis]|uniref:Molybdenum cofactor cytidylyltransferase n=1 Tax=Pseudoduganella namucuonensis TaxID=1035707 RepID=A0A1I7M1H1_9BURK|nr:nucleotidyltransferase family protein [Pseudoduganella namucuonensis]SFV15821.1 molybdenum cofactor cytidylyltransferase [Pseudoduganella namucuonensis]